MDRKLVSNLLGISEKSFYRWREERKIFNLLEKYFTDADIKEFLETDKINKLEEFLGFKSNTKTKEYQDFLDFKNFQEYKNERMNEFEKPYILKELEVSDKAKTEILSQKITDDEDSLLLTREMIHKYSTPKGGFTTAQVEFLGFSLKENWIRKAIKLKINKDQLLKFKAYGEINSKELKKLKTANTFFNIHNRIVK